MFFIYNDDCINRMEKMVEDGVYVDAIICDLPYGTTECAWDMVIDTKKLIPLMNKIIRPHGRLILFGNEPFYSLLFADIFNSGLFIYTSELIWNKLSTGNFLMGQQQPLRIHEKIMVFFPKKLKADREKFPQFKHMTYNPYTRYKTLGRQSKRVSHVPHLKANKVYIKQESGWTNYPKSIYECVKENRNHHITAKPVALMEHIIKLWTNENDVVLDFTMGSGSTGVACQNTKRVFIGIEKDEKIFKIAERRLNGNNTTITREALERLQRGEEKWDEEDFSILDMISQEK